MPSQEILDIVDEKDEIVGQATREDTHVKGLAHREIHVWFYTPNKEIIFQHRAKDKDTHPDLLDATVAGHVESGDTYEATAEREVLEETGLNIKESDLIPIKKLDAILTPDKATGLLNNAFKMQYAYFYDREISDLKIEEGKSQGFKAVPIEKLFNLQSPEKERFVPSLLTERRQEIFREIQKLAG